MFLCTLFFFFLPKAVRTLAGKLKIHQPPLEFQVVWISRSIKFLWSILCTLKTKHQKPPTNLSYKRGDRKESQLLKYRPYWFVSTWSYSETTTALYKKYHVLNLLFFKYKYALRTDGKRELVISNQIDPTCYTISPKDEGFSRKEHFTSLLDMLILILRKYSVICSISFGASL